MSEPTLHPVVKNAVKSCSLKNIGYLFKVESMYQQSMNSSRSLEENILQFHMIV